MSNVTALVIEPCGCECNNSAGYTKFCEKHKRIADAARADEHERCVNIARGCYDYGGGYSGEKYEIFHHGIQTVLTALTHMNDGSYQTRMLENLGACLFNDDGSRKQQE